MVAYQSTIKGMLRYYSVLSSFALLPKVVECGALTQKEVNIITMIYIRHILSNININTLVQAIGFALKKQLQILLLTVTIRDYG